MISHQGHVRNQYLQLYVMVVNHLLLRDSKILLGCRTPNVVRKICHDGNDNVDDDRKSTILITSRLPPPANAQ